MSLQLTPLQQHCLKGIGITPWQYRHAPTQPDLAPDLASPEETPSPVNAELLTDVREQSDITASICEAVKEPDADYAIPETSTMQPAHLIKELERALEYVAKHDKAIEWQVHQTKQLALKADKLLLPSLDTLFNSPSLKKQLWQLLSSPQS